MAAEAATAKGKQYAQKEGEHMWPEVGSNDFLNFSFGGTEYANELKGQAARAKNLSAIKCIVQTLTPPTDAPGASQSIKVMWMEHDFSFFGGSLGCAEGEKLTRGFEYACANDLPVIIYCASGGARMHEGTLSLMQMAKVSCGVQALGDAGLPFITLLADPCYGGVSASYAMQSDVRIGVTKGRLGFSGPAVILNTQFGMNQGNYDRACPDQFQSNEFGYQHGVVDIVVDKEELKSAAWRVLNVLSNAKQQIAPVSVSPSPAPANFDVANIDFLNARSLDRYDSNDILKEICSGYIDLGGDGKGPNGLDRCLRCGLATLKSGRSILVMKCQKGHSPTDREHFNHAMPTPSGYRTCLRFFRTAEKFGLPVLSLVDTVGAWPSFDAEIAGQSEAIATNLVAMAGLTVPMLTIVVGEGGSGGALAIAMGNKIGMLSNAYYSTITPEGAASILGRYKDEAHKKEQFPKDCRAIATSQNIYAPQLKELGVIDEVIWEKAGETYTQFPETCNNIVAFIENGLADLGKLDQKSLVQQRYNKFRSMGKFKEFSDAERVALLEGKPAERKARANATNENPKLLQFLTERTLKGEHSLYKKKGPVGCPKTAKVLSCHAPAPEENAKMVLDRDGPEAMAAWVRKASKDRVLLTDTTMRDAHQSLAATRMRTFDMLKGASEMSKHMHPCFSLECWGGATFDVSYRFLHEYGFERLAKLRKAIPNICFQMLLRGANGVGYKSYPDNVVEDFVRVAAKNGMDVFRIFDCFNDVEQMKVSISAVRKAKKSR
jgi:acetyl-CoA carboxylase carboxyl transferase alpha subunit